MKNCINVMLTCAILTLLAPEAQATKKVQVGTCYSILEAVGDIKVMKDYDRSLLNDYYNKYHVELAALVQEANDAAQILARELTDPNTPASNEIRQMALTLASDLGDTKPLTRKLDSRLMALVPKILSQNGFFARHPDDKKFGPIKEWSAEDLKSVENNRIANALYEWTLRRAKKNFWGRPVPEVNIENRVAGLIVDGSYDKERMPWEIVVFYSVSSKEFSVTLPPTKNNDGEPKSDQVHVEYYSPKLVIDLTNGSIRPILSAPLGMRTLKEDEPQLGSARIVGEYLHDRWDLEGQLGRPKRAPRGVSH